jgi:hypothetical protein
VVHIKGFSPKEPTTKFDPWKNPCDVEILLGIFKANVKRKEDQHQLLFGKLSSLIGMDKITNWNG